MKPPPFVYLRPGDLQECLEILANADDEAKIIAGGQSLVPLMNFRLARPSVLIDISRVPGLGGIVASNDRLDIGSTATHWEIESSEDLRSVYPQYQLLPAAARLIAHLPIRTRGTIGGSVAHADPSAEWPLIARLLDWQMCVQSVNGGERRIPAADFFQGYFTTAMRADELLTRITVPALQGYGDILELSRRKGDFAIVAAAAHLEIEAGICARARIALAGVADTPVRATEAEGLLRGQVIDEDVAGLAADEAVAGLNPSSDAHGSSDYRRRVARALIARLLSRIIDRSQTDAQEKMVLR